MYFTYSVLNDMDESATVEMRHPVDYAQRSICQTHCRGDVRFGVKTTHSNVTPRVRLPRHGRTYECRRIVSIPALATLDIR